MPVDPQYSSRSGASSFLKFAQTMCRIVTTLGPTIRARYPSRTALLAVLTAAESLCPLLGDAITEASVANAADYTFDPSDGTAIPGQAD